MHTFPWALPVLAVGVLAAALAGPLVGRVLCMPTWAAVVLISGAALVVAVTLSPLGTAAPGSSPVPSLSAHPVPVAPTSELWRWPWHWWPIDERTLNVALFVPLGIGVGLVGRRPMRWFLVFIAVLSPFAIEGAQYLVGWLARDADWRDVVDNVTAWSSGL